MPACLGSQDAWGLAWRTSQAEVRAGGAVLRVSTQVHNMAVGVARVILLGLFGPVLCLTDVQTPESSGKKGSWVGGSRTLLGPREPREWGPDSRDTGKSELEALTPGLREEGLGGLDPWV